MTFLDLEEYHTCPDCGEKIPDAKILHCKNCGWKEMVN